MIYNSRGATFACRLDNCRAIFRHSSLSSWQTRVCAEAESHYLRAQNRPETRPDQRSSLRRRNSFPEEIHPPPRRTRERPGHT